MGSAGGRLMFPLTADLPAANEASRREPSRMPEAAGEDGPPERVRSVAVGSVLGAMTLVVLDAGLTNLALPTIAGALGVSSALSVVVVTDYQTGLIGALLPGAALCGTVATTEDSTSGAAQKSLTMPFFSQSP